jgi:lantibiotic leader peptide-processing serine protease
MRNRMVIAASVALVAGGLLAVAPAGAADNGTVREYVVLYDDDASVADAHAAIESLDGAIVEEISQIGLAKVRTSNPSFESDVMDEAALAGAAPNQIIGYAEPGLREKVDDAEALIDAKGTTVADDVAAVDAEPLAGLQWDMEMIHATTDGSYAVDTGNPDVLVGIIDTGIDASHPDLASNFDTALSRNFTVDDPLIDGTCASDPDGLCTDPANVDEAGHGTHVSGTIAAALNGIGIAGIAPDVTLVNLRAGQDSGFFFLFETLQAYVYAANNGIDVVNMSYFTDPWWANCRDNPLDTPAEQQEQATIIDSSNLALNYAYNHGVTLIAAEGNEHTDLGNPTYDAISPDYPPGTAKIRNNIDNDCLVIPTEGDHVISVSALGPTGRKAYFSNYGLEQTVVSAPGGDRREFFGTPQYNTPGLRVLSTYPRAVAISGGLIDASCHVLNPLAVVDTTGGGCAVYAYLQGTSMASPHAVGVAALIIGAEGTGTGAGFGMSPAKVEKRLRKTATDTDDFFSAMGEDWRDFCPEPPALFVYSNDPALVDPNVSFDVPCEGNANFNGFYGEGVVDALAAASL